ncbi:MAG: efflux RND transporter permease subunit [Deltaproteobacteria bacterium]|nr:efflux RND transporter permease subunit [Deltaproteobacteria bacterium]
MIERIIEGSAKNTFFVFLMVVFLSAGGIWALKNTPLDAIPDLSDVQVIVYTTWMGRNPTIMEDQVTYPIVTTMISAPRVKFVRGFSDFGYSYVYIIFEDGTDIYWARSRVLEYLNQVQNRLPRGVTPTLGPDATGVGWVFYYALVDGSGKYDLAQLRSLQDWYLRYQIASVEGVAEVASLGGFVRQYQVNLDPNRLSAYRLPVKSVVDAIRMSNNDVGGRSVELSGAEYMVRGRGYIKSIKDIEMIAVGSDGRGTPILVRDIGRVALGPDMRRGIAELDGKGQVVGGIVVMRYGENALNLIDRVKKKLKEIEPSLPQGVKIVTAYDRSDLILKSIATLKEKLIEESLIVSAVCLIFLFHVRSALVAILTLPIAIIISFIAMYYLNLTSNIMSLGGIAIAIGAMVDAAIVMVENAHKRLEKWEEGGRRGSRNQVIIEAAKEVGKPLFYSLLIITVSFLPVFTLEAQEGRLFKPLAFTKTFAMFFSSLLSVTLAPVLMVLLIRGRIHPEAKNPVNRFLIALYLPVVHWVLRFKKSVIFLSVAALIFTYPAFSRLGSEFMPPLNEGMIYYMPTTLPGISITQATWLLQMQDRILKSFPEVEWVFGKAGRAETSTDPAPFSMGETTVMLKPESQWRKVAVDRSHWPRPLKWVGDFVFGKTRFITWDELVDEMDKKLRLPGVANAWTMPIKNRIDMLSTGIRTPIGIKIFGPDLSKIEEIGKNLEGALQMIPGTRTVYAERVTGGYYLDFDLKREEIARYGLVLDDVQMIIESAIGGESITTTVEGRERYPVSVRYARELRDDVDRLKRVLIPAMNGAQVPLGQLAEVRLTSGPAMIRDEDAQLSGYVYVDMTGRDIGGYVEEAQKKVSEQVQIPTGYTLVWSGQYEYMQRAKERLIYVVPFTLLIIFVLLYMNFQSVAKSFIVLLSVPFAIVGAVWLLYLLGYNLSVAVWVGIIALAGVAAETGVVMIVYLDEVYERRLREGSMSTLQDLYEAIIEGAAHRVRPKMMTVTAIIAGLLPIMWSHGSGADLMKRIAAPMIGGMITSTVLTLAVIPAIYALWRGWGMGGLSSKPDEIGNQPEGWTLK